MIPSSAWGDSLDRRFAIVGNRTPSRGKLNLNDLPGDGGRMDVLVRAINSENYASSFHVAALSFYEELE